MSGTRLLIRDALAVLTGARAEQARSAATDLRIRGGVIVEMGRALDRHAGERVLDARDCVIYPGWVNTHHHLAQSLLKGVPDGLHETLGGWLRSVPLRYRHAFDERHLRLAARIGLAELLLSGCTTVADHHTLFHAAQSDEPAQVLFDEAGRLGLRFMLLRGGTTLARPGEPLDGWPLETVDGMVAAVERTAARFHQRGERPLRRVALAPTTVDVTVHPAELRPLAHAARRMGIPMHTHVSETVATIERCQAAFGCTPIEYLADHEWLGPDVFLAHATHLRASEQRLLAQTGTAVAHCPQSNARLGAGIASAPALDAMGVRVGLGVDGAASNEAADFLSEVHACWLLHRASAGAASRPRPEGLGETGVRLLSPEIVIHWATAGGAQVLGFEGVGTLQVGHAADIAVYDLDQPRYFGLHDCALAPVISGGRPRLKWLLIDGRVVVEDDTIAAIDMGELRYQARAAVRELRELA